MRLTSNPLSRAFVHTMLAVLVFSVWITVSPYVLPEAIPTTTHLFFGVLLSGLAVLFVYAGLSQPVHELGSTWHILVLALLVLVSALATLPRNNLLFWSDVFTSIALVLLSLYALYLTSRFATTSEDSNRSEVTNGN